MKKFNLLLSAVTLLLGGSSFVDAQNAKNPWGITVGAHAVDYRSVRGTFDYYFDTKNWDIVPPLSKISVIRNLNKSFNLDLTASVGEIDNKRLNLKDELFINAGLGIRYQFANDYLLKSSSWFDPYVRVGASYVYYDYSSVDTPGYVATQGSSKHPYQHVLGKKTTGEKNNFALQGGVGINFWITKNFGLNVASDYNWLPASGQDYFDFFQHTVGLTFRFGNNDWDGDGILNDVDACPEEAGIPTNDPSTNGCPDTDGDGVVDKIDECPLIPGPAENNGCPWPDTDGDGLTDNIDECPLVPGPIENNGCPWPDTDGDGIIDIYDACPLEPGIATDNPETNGCPDTDGDGVVDKIDECPLIPGPAENNGCPWPDTDGDGILDKDDACPTEAGIATNNPATNGCPDRDGDGVVDKLDECPDVKGPAENNGCPWTEVHVAKRLSSILFEYNSDKIVESSYEDVRVAAQILNSDDLKEKAFYIDGHADQRGSAAYNKTLSLKRAKALVKVLTERAGIDASRLTARGLGESQLLCTEETEACYQKNRRVEVLPRTATVVETKVIKPATKKKK